MNIIIQPSAKKNLKKLPKQITSNILKKLISIKENPLSQIERLKGKLLWKLRIDDYQCILYINTEKEEIHVLKASHRKNIYKNL